MKSKKVAIIILNWNGLADTLECLESVYRLDYPAYDVIVVDNASSDDSVSAIRRAFPQVTVLENQENLGYTGGNNRAMKYAYERGADYVWLLNNDTVVEADTLGTLVAVAESDPRIGMVSPLICYYDDKERVQFCGSYVDWDSFEIVYPEHREACPPPAFTTGSNVCLWGTALLIRRSVIEQIGYLGAEYFAYWEDTDYSVRVLKAGFRNYVTTSAKLYHKTPLPENSMSTPRPHYLYYMFRNSYFFYARHLTGRKFISYLRMHIAKLLSEVGYSHRKKQADVADAYFNAAWDAFHGISGPMRLDTKRLSPALKRILSGIFAWHPALWENMIKGDMATLAKLVRRQVAKKHNA